MTQAAAGHPAGVANEGYWGIPVKPNTRYRASFYAKAAPGFSGPIAVSIQSTDGKTIYASGTVVRRGRDVEAVRADAPDRAASRRRPRRGTCSRVDRPGTVWFSLVSLFPPTFKNQPNGFRADIMQMMVDMKPKFLRFPGGNFLEGDQIADRFEWKKTLGPLAERPGHVGPWGYRSSNGMGLHEFLLWAEDMGAEPLLARLCRLLAQGRARQSRTRPRAVRAGRARRDRVRDRPGDLEVGSAARARPATRSRSS